MTPFQPREEVVGSQTQLLQMTYIRSPCKRPIISPDSPEIGPCSLETCAASEMPWSFTLAASPTKGIISDSPGRSLSAGKHGDFLPSLVTLVFHPTRLPPRSNLPRGLLEEPRITPWWKGGSGCFRAFCAGRVMQPAHPELSPRRTCSSVQFSRSVVSDSLQPHGLQHARPPCPSPTPRVYSNSCPLSQ